MVYCAGSPALAQLETLVRLESEDVLLQSFVLIPCDVPDELVETYSKRLPAGWRKRTLQPKLRAIGDAWIRSGRGVALRVRSAVEPNEWNLLLNPRHPDFAKIKISPPRPHRFDPDLA
jgi:RES domain-containing protein